MVKRPFVLTRTISDLKKAQKALFKHIVSSILTNHLGENYPKELKEDFLALLLQYSDIAPFLTQKEMTRIIALTEAELKKQKAQKPKARLKEAFGDRN